ncbi:hypothetical protein FANTH_6311 [Fusarium anthophilum]|uniref:Serpin domain-containing protein n=1 Tax=Fusarium anthophilum TaxID=48485 RepID=A0A8H4ZJP1_9HYPO|nr:hypothetical protein FANTH_6311 [Fusarium anthophilum]
MRLAEKSAAPSSTNIPLTASRIRRKPRQLLGPSSKLGKDTRQSWEQKHHEKEELASQPSITRATRNIGWSLLQRLVANQVDATVLSPISVIIALAMLAGAADSHRQSQFHQKLCVTESLEAHVSTLYTSLTPLARQDLISLANAVFVDQSVELAPIYQKYLESFQAHSQHFLSLPDSAKDINSWISQNTLGQINDLLSSRALRNSHVVLVNATAFRGTWKTKFDPANTVLRYSFCLENGIIRETEMMFLHNTYVEIASSSDYTAVRLPYSTGLDSSPAALVAWLPNPGVTVRSLLEGFSMEQLGGLAFRRSKFSKFGFPKFKSKSKMSLLNELEKLGFTIKGNYPAMGSGPAEVTAMIHETFIKVDEEGAEAAAATAILVSRKSLKVTKEDILVLNRPFLYMIEAGEDRHTVMCVFMKRFSSCYPFQVDAADAHSTDMDKGSDQDQDQTYEFAKVLEDESVTEIYHSFTEALTGTNHRDHVSAFPVLGDQTCYEMLAILLLEYLNTCPPFEMGLDYRTSSDRDYRPYHENEEEQYEQHSKRSYHYSQVLATHPLAKYAAENLSVHLDKAAVAGSIENILAALDRLFVPGKSALQNWSIFISRDLFPASDSIFHIAAAVRDAPSLPVFVLEHFAELSPHLLDAPDHDGRTPLSYAAEGGQADITRFLLDKGVNPNSKGKDGRTSLHRALWHPHVVRILVNAGADPLAKRGPILEAYNFNGWLGPEVDDDPWRESVLGVAFSQHSDDDVREIFIPFIPPGSINLFFHQSLSFLYAKTATVEAFLNTGKVDVNSLWQGETGLYRASRCWMSEIVELLIDRGADPNKRCSPCWPSHEITDCERGPTPLHGVANLGRMECPGTLNPKRVAQALISAGADVNAFAAEYDNAQDMTPLHVVVKGTEPAEMRDDIARAQLSIAEVLLSNGADPNAQTVPDGNSPAHLASPVNLSLFDMLDRYGADINALNANGRTPLMELLSRVSCRDHRVEVLPLQQKHIIQGINKLLELGARPDVIDDGGKTIFHYIFKSLRHLCTSECLPLARKLLQAGMDINQKDTSGRPPILLCKSWQYLAYSSDSKKGRTFYRILELFHSFGMDFNSKDAQGRTVLWNIVENTDISNVFVTISKLVRLGANPRERTRSGSTLLHAIAKARCNLPSPSIGLSLGADAAAVDVEGNTPIHALFQGSARRSLRSLQELSQTLVSIGVPPLNKNAKGQTVLHLSRCEDDLKAILTAPCFEGLNLDEQDASGFTPLHYAAKCFDNSAKPLIQSGADPTVLSPSGLSGLHLAAQGGNANCVLLLLAAFRKRRVLKQYANMLGNGCTPLHYACRSGNLATIWALLRNGADPCIKDDVGLTPLHTLAEGGIRGHTQSSPPPGDHTIDIVGLLLRAGADVAARATSSGGNGHEGAESVTPLDVAVGRQAWVLARELLARGAKPHESYNLPREFVLATDKNEAAEEARRVQQLLPQTESSAVASPCWRGRWAADRTVSWEAGTRFVTGGQMILDEIAMTEDGDGEFIGFSMLTAALQDGDYDSIKEYAQLGGNLFLRGTGDLHFVDLLVEWGCLELLHCLAPDLMKVQDKAIYDTLLGRACLHQEPSLHIIEVLVEGLGVNINSRYNLPRSKRYEVHWGTALHFLADGKGAWRAEGLRYLLTKGADGKARDEAGMTPLIVCRGEEAARVLRQWDRSKRN